MLHASTERDGELRARGLHLLDARAIVHDARSVPLFAEAWSRGDLPGEPRFRLAAEGGSLDELVECARSLAAGAARSALLAVLPRCVCEQAGIAVDDGAESRKSEFGVAFGRRVEHAPCGSDPVGAFATCGDDGNACAVIGCPGTALGWQRSARSERWTQQS